MAPNLVPGVFHIVSVIEGKPRTSVGLILPAWQTVYLNGSVTPWVVRKEGHHTYRLSLGGYPYTGVIDDKVTASVHAEHNLEWRATYREFQDAYTRVIGPIDDQRKLWTVADDSPNAQIVIKPIIEEPSAPPGLSPTQLFRFVPAHD